MTAAASITPTEPDNLPNGYMQAIGWACTHQPTIEAYERSTGREVAAALDHFVRWVESNLVGKPGDVIDDAEAA